MGKIKLRLITFHSKYLIYDIEKEIEEFCHDKSIKSIDIKPISMGGVLATIVWEEKEKGNETTATN